jgi:hypothetical protein
MDRNKVEAETILQQISEAKEDNDEFLHRKKSFSIFPSPAGM